VLQQPGYEVDGVVNTFLWNPPPRSSARTEDVMVRAVEILHQNEIEVKSLIDHGDQIENLQKDLENYDGE
jgi:hypothetical protein